ncbi:TonB family protein [Emticicia oligotrophica DSM 17448]|uniref:TonB family protein n=1 Tax=Emticicia oligotrophica (strain DSM 17448 / CIP 109782 / MTCC 6937 / GPTSA100-15) TaxID=929562 RepID=A0ABM5N4X8_EMTOG|nr:TonB family protein [Emticicia oligotrophica]AFK04538.1 TonB family protein [Emticicia oligotrophica DSM 17448]
MKYISIIFILIWTVACQKPKTDLSNAVSRESEEIIDPIEEQPYYPGGIPDLFKYLGQNIKYPKNLNRNNITGKIFITFIINEDGSISDAKVIKGSLNKQLNNSVCSVINNMPKWVNNSKRKVKYTIPIKIEPE